MEVALRADEKIRFQVFAKGDGLAIFALSPETLGAYPALLGRSRLINRLFFSLKPSHRAFFSSRSHCLHLSPKAKRSQCSNSPELRNREKLRLGVHSAASAGPGKRQ